jgi:hypothetical protein
MAVSLPLPAAGRGRANTAVAGHTAAWVGAWVVLLGTLTSTVGMSWDIQWHIEVGPDTFFTLPHLFVYSGSAASGIASLVMVLLSTSAQRAGQEWPRIAGGVQVRVFGGTFAAPVGYLISGVGAAGFLLYGLMDLWWHSIYGFDAVLNTPSHVALFLSICITMTGSITVFSAARQEWWGKAGVIVAVPILIIFAPMPFNAFTNISALNNFDPVTLASVLCAPMLLIVGGLVIGRGGAIAIAATLGALQAFLWWFSPWAALAYANHVGLPLRGGNVDTTPYLPSLIPMFLGLAAVVVEAAVWLAHWRRIPFGRLMLPVGAVSGLIVGVSTIWQLNLTSGGMGGGEGGASSEELLLALFGVGLGLLAGYLGTRFGTMLRTALTGSDLVKET